MSSPAIADDAWASPAKLRGKKLIECGHGFIDPAVKNFPQWMADHPQIMSAYPFDGLCLRIWLPQMNIYLDRICMSGQYDVPESAVQDTIDAYKRVKWGRLTDNFLYWFFYHGGTSHAKLDNDTEWNRVLNNARLMARVARECGFKGIWFDNEPYQGNPFEGYSAELVKQRGKQWIEAVQSELPDVVILHLFLYSPDKIAKDSDAFANGMLAGITGKARIVHTYENSMYYGMTEGMRFGGHSGDRAKWQAYRDNVVKHWRDNSDDPVQYDHYVEVGAAVWWESKPNGWPGWPWPADIAFGNMPLALEFSDEYVYCWNEKSNYYRTLPDKIDPWVASTTNKTFNQGTEQVSSLTESFLDDPLTRGWYFDFDALAHEKGDQFAFEELPYIGPGLAGWSPAHQSLRVKAHRRGLQRHRYVHPVNNLTADTPFYGTIRCQISQFATDSNNVMLLGLFNAGEPDNVSSLTVQIWDKDTVKLQLAGDTSTITLSTALAEPLRRGPTYEFQFHYDQISETLHVNLDELGNRRKSVMSASASTKEAGSFMFDEYGVAMWNVDDTVTPLDTAGQYRVLAFRLNTPNSANRDQWATPLELRDKKLIECGHGHRWSGVTPQWMANNPQIMSIYPFDGIALRVYLDPQWCQANGINPEVEFRQLPAMHNQAPFLASLCMSGEYDVPDSAVQGTIDAYKKVKWGSLTDNFLDWGLRHGGTHFAKLDDDREWNRVLNNTRLMGKIAAECGFKGLWFDTEDYSGPPFEGYDAELVKRRGTQWIQALQAEKPDVVLMFTFIYDDSQYAARFSNFLNGILAGITGQGRIINAYENAFYYGFSDGMPRGAGWGPISGHRDKFSRCRDNVTNKWRTKSDDPARYDKYVEVGMAAWWDGKDNLTPGQPSPYGWSNMPLALAYSHEYVWCWDEFSNWYLTLPMDRLDARVASSTNMTFNQGHEQVTALNFDFSTNPMLNSNGWYFDYDALEHEAHSPFTFVELPYNWSKDNKTLAVSSHRRGEQRHRYVHPVKDQTQAENISGEVDFQIDAMSTNSRNVLVLGLFNAGHPDNVNSLTLQVWDDNTLKVRLAARRSAITLAPSLNAPLVTGRTYRFRFHYDAAGKTLSANMVEVTNPTISMFQGAASSMSLGNFSMDEFGVAFWNVGNTSTHQSTAWQYQIHSVKLNTPSISDN